MKTAFRQCISHISGTFCKGSGPDGQDGTSWTMDAGWAWRAHIYLSYDFFRRRGKTARCSQYYTLTKECYQRAYLGDYDDSGNSDNRLDDYFKRIQNNIGCRGYSP